MGRGSSGANGSATRLTGTDGKPIDLTGTPLRYGSEDKALTGGARSTIEAFEKARYKNKIEFSRFVDADGNVIEDNRGGRGSVGATLRARSTAHAMSHNHPRSDGMLGGTFSTGDINNFTRFAQQTYRATAPEGTYSISRGKKFDAAGLQAYYTRASKEARAKYESAVKQANAEYKSVSSAYARGNATYDQANTAYQKAREAGVKAFNTMLVENHNALRAGQKKYGYTYTLERRR